MNPPYSTAATCDLRSGTQLGELLDAIRPTLLRQADGMIHLTLRRRMCSADLVQETFLTASTKIREFRGSTEAEFRSWLKELFYSRLSDGVRKHRLAKRRSQHRETEFRVGHLVDRLPPPDEICSRQDETSQLLDAVSRLPAEHQAVVRLRYIEDCTFEQISEQLQISLSKAWRRCDESIELLRHQLSRS